jgi:zinc protease
VIARKDTALALARAATLVVALLPPASLAGPEIERWSTPNGAKALFVHAPEIPLVDARVTFAAGSARDGQNPGIARLANDLLLAGTGDADADTVARRIERHGGDVSTGSERDMAWIDMRSLAEDEHLAPVAETVGNVLARPAFNAEAIARHKQQQRSGQREQAQSPGQIADQRLWSALYPDHPYGHDPLGTAASLSAIERADLRRFHQRYYVAANANIAIVGAIEEARARELARTLVGDLAEGEAAPAVGRADGPDSSRTIRVSFPSTQAHVTMGRVGVARGYAAWPALYVANHILGGGGFTSRLFSRVREDEGLVYSIYSHASPMAAAGPYRITFQTRGSRSERARDIARREVERFLDQGPTADEIADAQRQIRGSFPLDIDSNAELTNYLSMMGFYGLPRDYLDAFPSAVRRVDAAAAHQAAREVLAGRPRVTVIVGGDRASSGGRTSE